MRNDPPAVPLDYGTYQASEARRRWKFSWLAATGAAFWVAELWVVLQGLASDVRRLVIDFKLKMPPLTEIVMMGSRLTEPAWVWAVLSLLAILCGFLGGRFVNGASTSELRVHRTITLVWTMFLLIATTTLLAMIALLYPVHVLLFGVSERL